MAKPELTAEQLKQVYTERMDGKPCSLQIPGIEEIVAQADADIADAKAKGFVIDFPAEWEVPDTL